MTQQPNYAPDGATDGFFGGGASLSFSNPAEHMNKWRGGKIVAPPTEQQRTNFTTKQPEVWPDGRPKTQLVVKLATSERDPSNPHDDGVRSLYIKSQMVNAVGTAIRAAGAPGLRVGGELYVMWTGEKPSNAGNPSKLYAAHYKAPEPGQHTDGIFGQPQTGPAPIFAQPGQQPPAAPPQYQPPAPAPQPVPQYQAPGQVPAPAPQYAPPAPQQAPQYQPTAPAAQPMPQAPAPQYQPPAPPAPAQPYQPPQGNPYA